jgi:hypothetical protein
MRVRLHGVTDWIAATARRRRATPVAHEGATPPAPPPPDAEKVTIVGDMLQASFPDPDEPLDDHLTALMLRLTIEPVAPPKPPPRKR